MFFEIIISILLVFLIIRTYEIADILLSVKFFLSDIAKRTQSIRDFKEQEFKMQKREADIKELEAMSEFIENNITPFIGNMFGDSFKKDLKEKAEKIKKNKNKK